MGVNISFDIAAVILLIVLFLSCIFRKMTSGISNRIFLTIIVTAIAATGFDIAAVTLDNIHSSNQFMLYVFNGGYLIMHFLSAPLYLLFVISLTDTWHKLHKNTGIQFLLFSPILLVFLAFAANIGNHLVFSVKEGYTRGPLFSLLYIVSILYVIYDVSYIIRYRHLFSLGKIFAISAVIPLNLAAMIVQMLFPSALVEMFFGAISLLIVSNSIQRPEDYIDSITGLMNLNSYAHNMKRNFHNEKHMRLIMINIGNHSVFRAVMGFDSSMQALAKIASMLHEVSKKHRAHADLYYLDNYRFRIVLYGKNMDKADSVAEAVNKLLKQKSDFNGLDICLSPYIVLARCPEEIPDFKGLTSFGVDFHQKNHYTGQIMYAGDIYDRHQLNIQNNIDMIIDRALREKSFQVYYQPIYSTLHKRFLSAEALIRLFDPQHGFISPETLITAAEKNGTIHEIGAFVFEQVCRFIASEGFEKLGLDYIEVNLSVAQCMNADLPDTLFSIMEKYGISPGKINLEITETFTVYEQKIMTENLEKLTQAGFSFSLDDYGTGYSNIKRVIQLPLKIIKLDKTFVAEQGNPKMWIFLKNTIEMLKNMNMKIVVEGVETLEMLTVFSDLECDFIQGYYFSKAIPEEEFISFISNFNQ